MPGWHRLTAASALVVSIAGISKAAQAPVPVLDRIRVGPEFSYDGLAYQPHGGFVVVSTGSDSSDAGVVGESVRCFRKRWRIDSWSTRIRRDGNGKPSVAVDEDGDFVVVWGGYTPSDLDEGVFAQRFDADGARIGTEFLVNTVTEGAQFVAHVDNTPAGGFVVVWIRVPIRLLFIRSTAVDSIRAPPPRAVSSQSPRALSAIQEAYESSSQPTGAPWQRGGAAKERFPTTTSLRGFTTLRGAAAGTEFRVNSYTPATQWVPSAIALAEWRLRGDVDRIRRQKTVTVRDHCTHDRFVR
jgi:hypothetical protein